MVYAKKSLGQNFLKSRSALRAIAGAGKLTPSDTVLEVGPGRGALTEVLLETGARVVAVEKDRELLPYLRDKFRKEIEEKKLRLMEGDILELSAEGLGLSKYKFIANIPYYITGEIIRKFLEEDHQPSMMVLLLQKEVAERITAKDGKESILSIAVKAYAKPRLVVKVPSGAFVPAPNVDSAVVAFEEISKDFFTLNNIVEKEFFTIVKAGFAHKRKKLGGNLKYLFEGVELPQAWDKIKDRRAEELSLMEWKDLLS